MRSPLAVPVMAVLIGLTAFACAPEGPEEEAFTPEIPEIPDLPLGLDAELFQVPEDNPIDPRESRAGLAATSSPSSAPSPARSQDGRSGPRGCHPSTDRAPALYVLPPNACVLLIS